MKIKALITLLVCLVAFSAFSVSATYDARYIVPFEMASSEYEITDVISDNCDYDMLTEDDHSFWDFDYIGCVSISLYSNIKVLGDYGQGVVLKEIDDSVSKVFFTKPDGEPGSVDYFEYMYGRKPVTDINAYLEFFRNGDTFCFKKTGTYYFAQVSELGETAQVIFKVYDKAPPEVKPAPKTAAATNSNVVIDGKPVSFEAYLIDGSNYIKLRDFAFAIKDTTKKFGVGRDEQLRSVTIKPEQGYTPVGGEMTKGDGTSKTALPGTASVYLGESKGRFTSYNIDGNNYFKLRDLCNALAIGIDWDDASKTVTISTDW